MRATDGVLVWRFFAAPQDRRIGAFGQLESAWPVHGSVLVLDGTAYVAAGRSSQLDGGIDLYGMDAASGQLRCQTKLAGPHYDVDNIAKAWLPPGESSGVGSKVLVYQPQRTQRAQRRRAGGGCGTYPILLFCLVIFHSSLRSLCPLWFLRHGAQRLGLIWPTTTVLYFRSRRPSAP